MSTTEFQNIVNHLKEASSHNLVSMNNLLARLKTEKDITTVPTLTTLAAWSQRTEHPCLFNLGDVLNPAGGIISGIYYYPQVKSEIIKYYGKRRGRSFSSKKDTKEEG
jgi:hypothetical protein